MWPPSLNLMNTWARNTKCFSMHQLYVFICYLSDQEQQMHIGLLSATYVIYVLY